MGRLLANLWLAASLSACASHPEGTAPLGQRIDAVFAHYDEGLSPGVAVMVIRGGEVVHARGYGYADLERRIRLTPSTPVRLGSVSKPFTTTAILLLRDRGELDLDDPAVRWVPEIERFGDGVTLRHLMTHTAGLPDYYDELERREYRLEPADDDPLATNADFVATYREWGEPLFAPGERYEYCNPCYEILALVIERLTGRSFGEFLEENVFEPLGMATAVVRDRPEVEIPGRAIGYSPAGDGFELDDDHPGNWVVGAGGIYASLEDLRRFDQALDAGTLLRRATLEEAWTPARLNDGSATQYGLGWRRETLLDNPAVGHRGGWVGFRTFFYRFPETGTTLILLANHAEGDREPEKLLRGVFEPRAP